jgi:hypothetical protein
MNTHTMNMSMKMYISKTYEFFVCLWHFEAEELSVMLCGCHHVMKICAI